MLFTREQVHQEEQEKQYKLNMSWLKKHGETYLYNCIRKQNLDDKVCGMKIPEYVEMLKKDLAQKNKK